MSKKVVSIILAGGFGTRIRYLLGDLPKPLAPVLSKPFLEWILRYLVKQNIKDVVLSTGYQSGKIQDFCDKLQLSGLSISCVKESEPLGTAGGFLNSVEHTSSADIYLVLNGDSLFLTDLLEMLDLLESPNVDGVILGAYMETADRFGTLAISPLGTLLGFNEKKKGSGIINAGVYAFKKTTLDFFPRNKSLSFEFDVFPSLVASGLKLHVLKKDHAPFIDIGTEQTLPEASSFIVNNASWFI